MTNEAKIITISLISMLLIGLFVVPLSGGESGSSISSFEPPDNTIISNNFEAGTGIGGIFDVIMGTVNTVIWFFSVVGGLILSGYSAGPLVALVNFIFTVMVLIAFFKMLPWT